MYHVQTTYGLLEKYFGVGVCGSYCVLDAAQHRCGKDAGEEGHEVQAGENPNENVESENFLTASYSNKVIVVAEVASTAQQQTVRLIAND